MEAISASELFIMTSDADGRQHLSEHLAKVKKNWNIMSIITIRRDYFRSLFEIKTVLFDYFTFELHT
jgi:hypothetical protein